MTRRISHSEVQSLLNCSAQHDFRYVGHLAGDALRPRTVAPLLSEGRAWGAGVAALHEHTGHLDATQRAVDAVTASLAHDAEQQRDAGLYDPEEHDRTRDRLVGMLAHYAQTTEPLAVDRLEHEIDVAIPSRGGRRRSNLYRLVVRLDAVHADEQGRIWIVEYKLRRTLSSFQQIVLDRQTRWYAWAWREHTGVQPAGVIVDERLNAPPAEVKLNQDGRPSRQQSCTPDAYVEACEQSTRPCEPHADILAQLRAKRWSQRHPLVLRPDEIDEAGEQLVSAARLVHDLDSGRLAPIRNPHPMRCGSCAYRDICPNPHDAELVDVLFERVAAKRDREETPA